MKMPHNLDVERFHAENEQSTIQLQQHFSITTVTLMDEKMLVGCL